MKAGRGLETIFPLFLIHRWEFERDSWMEFKRVCRWMMVGNGKGTLGECNVWTERVRGGLELVNESFLNNWKGNYFPSLCVLEWFENIKELFPREKKNGICTCLKMQNICIFWFLKMIWDYTWFGKLEELNNVLAGLARKAFFCSCCQQRVMQLFCHLFTILFSPEESFQHPKHDMARSLMLFEMQRCSETLNCG